MKHKLLSMALVLSVASLPSCKQLKKVAREAAQEIEQEVSGAAGNTASDAKAEHTNAAVAALRTFPQSVISSYERYLGWVDVEKGVTGEEKSVRGLSKITLHDHVKKSADQAASFTAYPELAEAAKAYNETIPELVSVFGEAGRYYEDEDYKDDAFAKAKELHPKIVSSYETFYAAYEKYDHALQAIQDREIDDDIAAAETAGREYEAAVKKGLRTAKKIWTNSNTPEISSIDADVIKVEIDELSAIHEQLKTLGEPSGGMGYNRYLSSIEGLISDSKRLMRRVRDKKDFTESEKMMGGASSWTVSGSPAAVLRKYNDLVNAYNSMRY